MKAEYGKYTAFCKDYDRLIYIFEGEYLMLKIKRLTAPTQKDLERILENYAKSKI